MYPEHLIAPMRHELTDQGFKELKTVNEVSDAIESAKGVSLLVINSVCGCAAGGARPGAIGSLKGEKKPDNCYTVFAGVDNDAVKKVREYLVPYPPSSPSIAVFKDGKLVHMIERHHIEGRTPNAIAQNLQLAFEQYCN